MLPRDQGPVGFASSLLDSPARTYVRGELAGDADITRPNNPMPRIEIPSAPPAWHVHLELRPEQLVTLHRMGFTSGALAWREGMDRWQPLSVGQVELAESDPSSPSEWIESSGESVEPEDSDDRTESASSLQRKERRTTGRSGSSRPSSGRAGAVDATRRSFVFPRGRRPTGTVTAVQAMPVALGTMRPPPPPALVNAQSAEVELDENELEDIIHDPLLPAPRLPSSLPAPSLALVPKPAWLTQAAYGPSSLDRLASVPPLSMDSPFVRGPMLRPRTLWLGAAAVVVMSACVAALVSSMVWQFRSGGSSASLTPTAEQADTRAVRSASSKVKTDTAEPQPTSVSVDELPLLMKGAQAPAATITATSAGGASTKRAALVPASAEKAGTRGGQSHKKAASPEARVPSRRAAAAPVVVPSTPGPPDRAAIAGAVNRASGAARSCGSGPENGQLVVTFAPSGSAQSIQLLKPFSNRDTNACVLRAMSRARVPAFIGEPVSVRKSLRW